MEKLFNVLSKYIVFIFCFVFISGFSQEGSKKVVLFYSTDCPICINYINKINSIDSICRAKNIEFLIVLPKNYNKKDAKRFNKKYKQNFDFWFDKQNQLVEKYRAHITPEVFYILNDSIRYSGAIDNWYMDIGKRRSIITENYLLDAINLMSYKYQKIKAVGCFINK